MFSHLETKNASWNPLKTKQIQKLAVMAIWRPTSRLAGRPTGQLERKEELSNQLKIGLERKNFEIES